MPDEQLEKWIHQWGQIQDQMAAQKAQELGQQVPPVAGEAPKAEEQPKGEEGNA